MQGHVRPLVIHVLTGCAIKEVEEPEYLSHVTYDICLCFFPKPFCLNIYRKASSPFCDFGNRSGCA